MSSVIFFYRISSFFSNASSISNVAGTPCRAVAKDTATFSARIKVVITTAVTIGWRQSKNAPFRDSTQETRLFRLVFNFLLHRRRVIPCRVIVPSRYAVSCYCNVAPSRSIHADVLFAVRSFGLSVVPQAPYSEQ